VVSFTGAHSDYLIERSNKDLAITDLPSARTLDDGLNCGLNLIDWYGELQHDLRQEIVGVFSRPMDFALPMLSGTTATLCDIHAEDAALGQCRLHMVEPKWLDNGGYHFHADPLQLNISKRRTSRRRSRSRILDDDLTNSE
jgi:hypothetical protein